MEWRWACKICNLMCDDASSLIQHFLKDHRAAINYGTPVPIDMIPALKEKAKVKPKQYEPVEEEDELPEEVEEDASYKPKKKPPEDRDFEDLSLE